MRVVIESWHRVKTLVTRAQGDTLLIRELNPRTDGYSWNVISGTPRQKVGGRQEDPLETARREVNEEAGIEQLDGLHVLGSYFFTEQTAIPGTSPGRYVVVRGTTTESPRLARQAEQAARHEDIVDARWFSPEELGGLEESDVHSLLVLDILAHHLGKAALLQGPSFEPMLLHGEFQQ